MPVIKLAELFLKAASFFHFILTARHRKGRGIHSPYAYTLVADVSCDRSFYKEYDLFTQLRDQLKNTDLEIEVENYGSPSKKFKKGLRKVSELAKISSIDEKHGKLLFRLVKFYKPKFILELGTSIGLATTYLSKGYPKAKIVTIEGNGSLCSFAHKLFLENNLRNIEIKQGLFDDLLPEVLSEFTNHCLIFIDGNHSYEPTLHYFNSICNNFEECMIVFDDINWSSEMRLAWKEIYNHPVAHVSIDLYFMGIVIKNKDITPGKYKVWF